MMMTSRLQNISLMLFIVAALLLGANISGREKSGVMVKSVIEVSEQRGVEQTFLTFPEWYLVHSPAEFAQMIAKRPAHDFPFVGHIQQLWSSYSSVIREQIRQDYPANLGYHVMILVISTSTTVEYGLRWIYENSIGRISWALSSAQATSEEQYAAKVAQEYVDFIRQQPWYLFDFTDKLKELWNTVPATGPNMIRKWERRYALTTEYLIKAAYGKIIELATKTAYTPALMTTQVQVDHFDNAIQVSGVKLVRQLPDGSAVLDVPRYYDFRLATSALAMQGVRVLDVAGNQSVILVSAWVNANFTQSQWRVLFQQDLITMPGMKRVALIVPIRELSNFLLTAPAYNINVEHVYDY